MTALTPAEAAEAIRTARAEQEEAEQFAAALEERVLDGDPEVTPAKLGEARELVRFAELRVTAAERKHAAAQEAARHATARSVAERAVSVVRDDDGRELTDAMRAVVDAVSHLAAIAERRHATVTGLGTELRGVTELLGGDVRQMRERYGVAGDREQIIVYEPRTVVQTVPPAAVLAAAVRLGVGPGAAAHAVGDALTVADQRVKQVFAAVPALAEEWRYSPEDFAELTQEQRLDALATAREPLPQEAA
ncbi:hypothetical protein [Streptomyces sp. NRRL S-146]|uniref:hypothetical protein n=1 Tax=Streptomyces sp. NRRL S-146 TaxID=1463884 RepID=UPI0004CA9704|nr:hypothetical protein [Streptomyces sp. NRRL S-146]